MNCHVGTKDMKIRKILFGLIFVLICSVGCGPEPAVDLFSNEETSTEQVAEIEHDSTREKYNKGSCKRLTDSPYVLVIFVDDEESSWDTIAVSNYWYENVIPAMAYIEDQANGYGISLSMETGSYATDTSREMSVKYDGIISNYTGDAKATEDLLEQCAVSLGFEDEYQMHEYLQSHTGKEQIVYMIAVNKPGRSYCMSTASNSEYLEHCVLYTVYPTNKVENSMCVAHEFFHLFGAEDLYDPYGKQPRRAELAKEFYPDDIMFRRDEDVYQLSVGSFTAYTLGWTDEMPEECNRQDWWE